MNDALSKFIVFAAGVAIGSAVTWKLLKDKYARIAQEEIDSVKETLLGSKPSKEEEPEEDDEVAPAIKRAEKPDIREYQAQLQGLGYTDYAHTNKNEIKKVVEVKDEDAPFVIPPEEFDENGYDTRSFTYYADNVLVDEEGIVIENVEELIGTESLDHFGEYEMDSVFVRNNKLKTDFEILRDLDEYWGAE